MFQNMAVFATIATDQQHLDLNLCYHDVACQSAAFMYVLWQASQLDAINSIAIEFGTELYDCLVIPELIKEFVADIQIFGVGIKSLQCFITIFRDGHFHSRHDIKHWVLQADVEESLINCSSDWAKHNFGMGSVFRFQRFLYRMHGSFANCDADQIRYLEEMLGEFSFLPALSDEDLEFEGAPGDLLIDDLGGHTQTCFC